MDLSIIIPAYDERETIGACLVRVGAALPELDKEIIVVDDCSSDGTTAWLRANADGLSAKACAFELDPEGALRVVTGAAKSISVRLICHEVNKGKGGALQTGLAAAAGDVVVIQDADLEYDPDDWGEMYELIAIRNVADIVYGSRFYGRAHRALYFHHYMANRLISFIFNALYNQQLTDIEVCYKMFTKEVLDSLRITANDFGFEVQFSAQVALARRWRIYEIGIRYFGRTYDEGKKINWKDGVKALWYLVKFRFD
ncbi:MAG: glycosyltransferase family 2 protein [Gammaproteobacteria bacterium]|jgi:glycosyltransferase involved in cell wall biosynthesis|nr:glycosyltransferase family 2 protein [Gammaproteobacteria bacterium]HJP35971.1 glycosyltransferase family 2 protein [Gammaproteobacteria bacterium]